MFSCKCCNKIYNFLSVVFVAEPNNPVDHPDYCIIKIGVLNEAGSLVRALLAFKVSFQ